MHWVIPSRPTIVVACLICVSNSWAAESEYCRRVWSLLDANNSGPTLTNLSERARASGEVAGAKLGMTMSEVVRVWGKPQIFYSACGGGPRFDYQTASLFFYGDKLRRIWIRTGGTSVERDPGTAAGPET